MDAAVRMFGDKVLAACNEASALLGGAPVHSCAVVFSCNEDGSMNQPAVVTTFGSQPEGIAQCADVLRSVALGQMLEAPLPSEKLN